MKATLAASVVFPLLAVAAPTNNAPNPPFAVMALRSASPVHFLPMTASGLSLWLGGETASYCPSPPVSPCPPGNETVFAPGGSAMDVEVPGGQQVYVNPDGALSYTVAHSASIPPGSSMGPFTYTPPTTSQPNFGHYSFSGFGASGFMACPNQGRWQVFAAIQNATVPEGDVSKCLGFDAAALTYQGTESPAWQYT